MEINALLHFRVISSIKNKDDDGNDNEDFLKNDLRVWLLQVPTRGQPKIMHISATAILLLVKP